MGRVTVLITVSNPIQPDCRIAGRALADTGASSLVLPLAWKAPLGFHEPGDVRPVRLGDQRVVEAERFGPVRLEIPGFDEAHTEVYFLPLEPEGGEYLAILGQIPLQQVRAAVDVLNHQLIPVPYYDLRRVS